MGTVIKFITALFAIIITLFLIGEYPSTALVVVSLGIVFLFLVFGKDSI